MKSSKIMTVDYTTTDNEEARSLIQTDAVNSDKYDIFQYRQFKKRRKSRHIGPKTKAVLTGWSKQEMVGMRVGMLSSGW